MKKDFWTIVKEIIRKADVVLEILDARMPELTRNKSLENYAEKNNKPLILVINKADLVSEETIKNIKERYRGSNYAICSSKKPAGISQLVTMIKVLGKARKIRVAFIGYPNTGKSSLLNRLSRGGRAKTSSVSGFTKGLQLIAGRGDLRLFDTPGVVPFDKRDETQLGLMSGISPTKLKDPDLVACELIEIFKENNPKALEKEYGINSMLDSDEILEEFGKKRHLLRKGGEVDEKRAAIQILTDWHKGKIRL